MTSFIGDKVSAHWQNENGIKLGGSFSVFWLCFCELSFERVKDLQNPLNNQENVSKSRDCTELPKDIGIKLCLLCFEQEKIESNNNKNKNFIDLEKIKYIEGIIKKNKDNQNLKMKNNINNNNTNNINNNMNGNFPMMRPGLIYPNYMMPGMYNMFSMGMMPIIPNQQIIQQQQQLQNLERERERERSRERRNKSKSRSRKGKDD